jgi:hypothetical protein
MNTLFKVILFVFPAVLLIQCERFDEEEHGPNDPVEIPDQAFFDALIEDGVDTNGDSIISYSSLDLSNNTALKDLRCNDSRQLNDLNISGCAYLNYLNCEQCKLSILDVSHNTALIFLYCGENQLTSLDVSGNLSLVEIEIGAMGSLQKVCVWTRPFPPDGVIVYTPDSPNIFFTTDCSRKGLL